MNLTKRFLLYNVGILVIPLIITILVGSFFAYGIKLFTGADPHPSSAKKLLDVKYELFTLDMDIFNNDAERLLEKDYQQLIIDKLKSYKTDMIVIKDGMIAFSSDEFTMIDVEKCINASKKSVPFPIVSLNNNSYVIKPYPLNFKNGSSGNVILLTAVGKEGRITYNLFWSLVIFYLVLLVFTCYIFALKFSNTVTKPISKLKKASKDIASGSFNEVIYEFGDEEVKSLCRSFEEMRVHLKNSIDAQKKLDENRKFLVSSISHDLKTPITSIKGYVEGINDGIANTEEKRNKYLQTIYSKAVQIDNMVDDLLLYSKLDLNQLQFNFERVNIVHYLEDCITEYKLNSNINNIIINLSVPSLSAPIFVNLDRERMHRVVTNIIDNSKKYMDKEICTIDILLRETSSSVVIEFKDNGRGISKEEIQNIFDRFYRSDKARSNVSGSGLGLAISKQIVEGHKGNIWAKSTLKLGTSILISLPKESELSKLKTSSRVLR